MTTTKELFEDGDIIQYGDFIGEIEGTHEAWSIRIKKDRISNASRYNNCYMSIYNLKKATPYRVISLLLGI